jgi:hypothetical protein
MFGAKSSRAYNYWLYGAWLAFVQRITAWLNKEFWLINPRVL